MQAIYGSSTILQKPIATAASTALPPACSMARPASADGGCMAVTTPFRATTSSLFVFHVLRNAISVSLPRPDRRAA